MRTSSSLLDALLPQTTQDVLAALMLHADREWYLSDLADHLGVRPSSLQRVLGRLVAVGLVRRRPDGNRVYFQADTESPIHGELVSLLTKTVGIREPLRQALLSLGAKVRIAFVHGSIAQARETSRSDIDLIVIGDVSGIELTGILRGPRGQLGREINTTRYTEAEFGRRVAEQDHFLSAILEKPRMMLIGQEHELETLAGRKTRRRRADQQVGTRRHPRHDLRQSA